MNEKTTIGPIIKEVFEKSGLKMNDLAKKIGTVRQNIYKIFDRKSIDTDLLMKLSEVLQHDFFQYYKPGFQKTMKNSRNDKIISLEFELMEARKQLSQAKQEIEYLKKIIDLMEDRVKLIALKTSAEVA